MQEREREGLCFCKMKMPNPKSRLYLNVLVEWLENSFGYIYPNTPAQL